MSKTRFVAADGLEGFLAFLSQQAERVLAPVEKPASSLTSIVFAPWQKGSPFTLAKATMPPKAATLPECETLFTFRHEKNGADERKVELNVADPAVNTIIFGCRPCDARGISVTDKPFLSGLYVDPYYKARRDKLTIISLTCDSGCETCFCHWVDGGPTSPTGSDILMTGIEGGYVLQAITDKGQELLDKSSLEDGAEKFALAGEVRKKAWASLVPAPDIKDARASLAAVFSNPDFWDRQTAQCLSCGACTYFCPSCYCFNITDEGESQTARGGKRIRSWDNCMSSLYSREASGHNPRPHKAQRMRNRVSHKFWTYPENWASYLCTGCGRCIAQCPVHLDIRAIVLAAIAENTQKAAE